MKASHIVLKKKKRKTSSQKKYNQNCVTINGSCAFVYLVKHRIPLKQFLQMMRKKQNKTQNTTNKISKSFKEILQLLAHFPLKQ